MISNDVDVVNVVDGGDADDEIEYIDDVDDNDDIFYIQTNKMFRSVFFSMLLTIL